MGAYESAQIRAIVQDLEEFTEKTTVKLCLNITSNLKRDTPKDTGWAAANWVPSIGKASPGVPTPEDRDKRLEAVSAQIGAQTTATAGLFSYKLQRGKIFVSNNVPYIGDLNDGSSRQAPAGFVQRGIEQGIRQLEGRAT